MALDRRFTKNPNKLLKPDYSMDSAHGPTKEKALMHTSNKKIFIGPAYQAVLPPLLATTSRDSYERFTPDHETLLWEPTDRVSEAKIDALVAELKTKGFDEDQILPFFRYQDFNIDATLHGLSNVYVGKQEGMPLHDKVLFVQGYGFHGKNFERIHDLLPSHSIHTLISHYYTEFKKSKQSSKNPGAQVRPEADVKKITGLPTNLHTSPDLYLSRSQHFSSHLDKLSPEVSSDTNTARPVPTVKHSDPDRLAIIETLNSAGLKDEEVARKRTASERARIQELTEAEVTAAEKLEKAKETFQIAEDEALNETTVAAREEEQKDPTPVWQQSEIQIFMRCLVEFGTDFTQASRLLPNKTEQQVRNMYYNRCYFYGLDQLVKFHETVQAKLRAKKNAGTDGKSV
ncbi:hypothetical protein RvY_13730 [Ramazzottius varieornatus]|uniref:ELM2 domain-containing protein n=1 Tax=Ramazzottius varieornatus TaxID=947166 RepID=A0A1D1VSY3_RAMVA|nr:hypothetical protein RvY_13730 [Ramazzottius varieornatus]